MEQVLEAQQEEQGIRSRRSALLMGGAALAGLALTRTAEAQAAAVTDNDILNFALNLEYLEAQFYSLAVNGTTIDASLLASGDAKTPAGTVTYKAGLKATVFTTPQLAAYAKETANDELNHVKDLRSALSTNAVAMPNINLLDSFNTLGTLLGLGNFDPFDGTETSFLLGAFIFEDVGVTAYLGAAPLIASTGVLTAALAIHAVEAYHAGAVRTQLYRTAQNNPGVADLTEGVAGLRQKLSSVFDTGVARPAPATASTIVDVDVSATSTSNSRVQPRTPTQVLDIVYGGSASKPGLFFTSGMNGTLK